MNIVSAKLRAATLMGVLLCTSLHVCGQVLVGVRDSVGGVQVNLLSSVTTGRMSGLQLSVMDNVSRQMGGMQLSALLNANFSAMRGLQLAGVSNLSGGVARGAQLSPLTNLSTGIMGGAQLAAYNYADTLRGAQVGIFNVAVANDGGTQVGLVNISREPDGHRVGLVNISPATRYDIMLYGGTASKTNLSLRLRNPGYYNVVTLGTHYMGLDRRFSGALGYRVGVEHPLSTRWSLTADVGYAHIETFAHDSSTGPERFFALQGRVSAELQLTPSLEAFATVGYENARRYSRLRLYRSRPLVEAGIAMSYSGIAAATARMQPRSRLLPRQQLTAEDSLTLFAADDPQWQRPHPWRAAFETAGLNVFVNFFDRYPLQKDYARISLHTIRDNLRTGFVWDNDFFATNTFAHPYHGGLYFNTARANGLSFWTAIPYAAGGSLMWEAFCETEPPAINDLFATTIGGTAIGEITFRLSSLILDDHTRGARRFWREAAATLVSPMRGFNRIVTGQAWRYRADHYAYHDHTQLPVTLAASAGVRYLADGGALFRGEQAPYLSVGITYGNPFSETTRKPYDFFSLNATVGLSSNQPLISELRLLGRLWTTEVRSAQNADIDVGVFQYFTHYNSEAVRDGSKRVPYRISEAASVGPGLISQFTDMGHIKHYRQGLFAGAMLLGGAYSDYYNFFERDYNMGSGFSLKSLTQLCFANDCRFDLRVEYFSLYTWKGYEQKDYTNIDPHYLNVQGERSWASLIVVSPQWHFPLSGAWAIDARAIYYGRNTHYHYFPNVESNTFEVRLGLKYSL